MKFKLYELTKEFGISDHELIARLSHTGYDVIDIPLREVHRIFSVKPVEHVKVTVGPMPPPVMKKESIAKVVGELSAHEVSDMLGLHPKIFLQAIKKRKLPIPPTRVTRGPKGCHRYYFDDAAAQALVARQEELKSDGVMSTVELKKLTGLGYGKINNVLRRFPRVKDGFLLQTRGSTHFGACRAYFKPGALEVLQGFLKKQEAASA